jgi:sulfhydrogenase subunit beta (sulfur reductase)
MVKERRCLGRVTMSNPVIVELSALQALIDALLTRGYQVIGPRLENGAIVYGAVTRLADLPAGCLDEQDGGQYRLTQDPDVPSLFRYAVGPHSWKRYLFPPRQRLWRAARGGGGFHIETSSRETPKYAFLGVRACELAAMAIQDRVFDNGDYADSGYRARRKQALLIAVNCTRAGGSCFCASAGSGPRMREGYDLALTELIDGGRHRFLLESGSDRGTELLWDIPHQAASATEVEEANRQVDAAARSMTRRLPADAAVVLARNPEHPRWRELEQRCLGCANCTLVCPTCFCSTVEDSTSLDGATAERVRRWDSCFSLEFSYIHGGPTRRSGAARYRQWITHKLSTWHEQFGTAGCTGCGRCITWCPVGIDITAEVAAIAATETATGEDP